VAAVLLHVTCWRIPISTAPVSRARPGAVSTPGFGRAVLRGAGGVRTALDQTGARAVLLVLLVSVAYAFSLASLVRAAMLGAPLGLLFLVPLVVLALAWGRLRREPATLPIHDRQVDYIVGLGLIAAGVAVALLLPTSRSNLFWFSRLDLLGMPLFTAGLVGLFYGVRRAWSLRWPIAALLLAWPVPWRAALDFVGAGTRSAILIVVVLLLVGAAGVLRARRAVRLAWLAGSILLVVLATVAAERLAGPAGESGDVARTLSPLLILVVPAAVLAGLLRNDGSRTGALGSGPAAAAARPNAVRRLGWAPVIAVAAALVLGMVNVGYARYDEVLDDIGNPIRPSFLAVTGLPAGWTVSDGEELTAASVARPLAGAAGELERRILVGAPDSEHAGAVVVMDVVSTPQGAGERGDDRPVPAAG
jgi:hypothetical protein